MRILYAGSPDISATVLNDLCDRLPAGFEIAGVLTNPPTAKGRHGDLTPTDVGQVAINRGLILLTPETLKAEAREAVAALQPDILVCFAYGRIFGPKFMELFPLGGINLHPSLLPKYRGCAPAQAAILNREPETGITIQKVALEMDTGDILLQTHLPLTGTETAESLLDTAAAQGADLIIQVLQAMADGTAVATPQAATGSSYCEMLKKEDGCIDWSRSAAEIDAQIRAFYSWPLCWTSANGLQLRIHKAGIFTGDVAACGADCTGAVPGKVLGVSKKDGILIQTGDGILALQTLQWQAKKAMSHMDFLNGSRNFIGTICGAV